MLFSSYSGWDPHLLHRSLFMCPAAAANQLEMQHAFKHLNLKRERKKTSPSKDGANKTEQFSLKAAQKCSLIQCRCSSLWKLFRYSDNKQPTPTIPVDVFNHKWAGVPNSPPHSDVKQSQIHHQDQQLYLDLDHHRGGPPTQSHW